MVCRCARGRWLLCRFIDIYKQQRSPLLPRFLTRCFFNEESTLPWSAVLSVPPRYAAAGRGKPCLAPRQPGAADGRAPGAAPPDGWAAGDGGQGAATGSPRRREGTHARVYTHLLGRPCSAPRTRAPSRWPGLSSWASAALQRNWRWQRRTWQQWGRWRGSSVRRCAVLQQGRDRGKDTSHLQPRTCGMEVCQNRSVTSVPVTSNRRDGCPRLTRII